MVEAVVVRLVGKQRLSMVSMNDDQERSLYARFPCMPTGGFRALMEMSKAWAWWVVWGKEWAWRLKWGLH